METPLHITERVQFARWAARHGLTSWHEPDQADITARFVLTPGGTSLDLDNAMGPGRVYGMWPGSTREPRAELFVTISELVIEDSAARRGRDLVVVSLATLCEWAADDRREIEGAAMLRIVELEEEVRTLGARLAEAQGVGRLA